MDYQEKYQSLKRKLKVLLYEQESFQKDLEKSQIKLLRVSRDKTFLLDRLLLYEQVSEDSLDDSDATLSSDNESESSAKKKNASLGPPLNPRPSQETKNEKSPNEPSHNAAREDENQDCGNKRATSVQGDNSSTPVQVDCIKQEKLDEHLMPTSKEERHTPVAE